MSTALRKLANDPLPDLATKSFLGFKNYVVPGLMSADDLERYLATSASNITATDALAAIKRGFRAAERKLP